MHFSVTILRTYAHAMLLFHRCLAKKIVKIQFSYEELDQIYSSFDLLDEEMPMFYASTYTNLSGEIFPHPSLVYIKLTPLLAMYILELVRNIGFAIRPLHLELRN